MPEPPGESVIRHRKQPKQRVSYAKTARRRSECSVLIPKIQQTSVSAVSPFRNSGSILSEYRHGE